MIDINFDQLIDIVQLTIIIIGMVLLYRSFPAKEVEALLEKLAEPVSKTETKLDDLLLDVARTLNELRKSIEQQQQTIDDSVSDSKPEA